MSQSVAAEANAKRALALLDLTNLNDDCDEAAIDALCAAATPPHGNVAAVCVWPRFVSRAKARLEGSGVRVATVANFPTGEGGADLVATETTASFADGADEVDVVIPWNRLRHGDPDAVVAVLAAAKGATPDGRGLKAILETGALEELSVIERAAALAVEAGVDFLKTSTGKHPSGGASLEAAEILLSVIRGADRRVGFKASGGVRTTADAAAYLSVADRIMGADWARPETFRFGASGLLADLLAALDGAAPAAGGGY